MSNRWSFLAFGLIALLGPAAAPASAGVSQVALKQLADGSAAVLKQLAKSLATSRGAVELTIDGLEHDLTLGTLVKDDLVPLYTDLETMQVAVRTAVLAASDQLATESMQAMATLAAGGVMEHDYPRGFLFGDGGTLDDFRLDVDAKLRKHYTKLRARIAKLSKKLEAKGICLCVRIDPPIVARERVTNSSSTGFSSNLFPLTVDLLVGIADIDGATTGDLRASGTTFHGKSVEVSRFTSFSSSTSTVVAGGNDRWKYVAAGIDKHNYCVRVATEDFAASELSGVGLR